ncbi:hypothetical protein GU3_13955 [Oceanimonas sp. GK1]|uniref:hypothetical protein n=1 Tax=Oceanimonas sp. (strain GK1 / IBRC-M 10197) TaxID=511062 RepID=UPI0002495681|nr:hypothetical protein [Oceanimonas sp. GK1]AEY02544.1 hypothetical protein GU3_13955 [Oceanimonas sp. GK1]
MEKRNPVSPPAENPVPPAPSAACGRAELGPIFARLLMLQQSTAQACEAGQWGWLSELDKQLKKALEELAPYRHQLNARQRDLLQRFAEQYRAQWSRVRLQAEALDSQLDQLRQQHQGTLAYDWVSQLEDEA